MCGKAKKDWQKWILHKLSTKKDWKDKNRDPKKMQMTWCRKCQTEAATDSHLEGEDVAVPKRAEVLPPYGGKTSWRSACLPFFVTFSQRFYFEMHVEPSSSSLSEEHPSWFRRGVSICFCELPSKLLVNWSVESREGVSTIATQPAFCWHLLWFLWLAKANWDLSKARQRKSGGKEAHNT